MSHVELSIVIVTHADARGMLACHPDMTHLRGTSDLMTQVGDD
jgi:hypothetical protein